MGVAAGAIATAAVVAGAVAAGAVATRAVTAGAVATRAVAERAGVARPSVAGEDEAGAEPGAGKPKSISEMVKPLDSVDLLEPLVGGFPGGSWGRSPGNSLGGGSLHRGSAAGGSYLVK